MIPATATLALCAFALLLRAFCLAHRLPQPRQPLLVDRTILVGQPRAQAFGQCGEIDRLPVLTSRS